MKTTVSSKYQIVIPKEVRRKFNIKPGQKVNVDVDKAGKITITPPMSADDYIKKYAGSLKGAWGGKDPAEFIRKMRGEEWD